MSKSLFISVTCPNCSIEENAEAYSSINITVHPDLRDKLFKGELNNHRCTNCYNYFHINIPLLYHDMEIKFGVQYYSIESFDENSLRRTFDSEGKIKLGYVVETIKKICNYLETPQVVFSMNEMVRYLIFREKTYNLHHNKKEIKSYSN